ncbi:MAG TPA: hypothetical protein VNK96_04520 [Fimbriimonadales bacterium]|nr:hypothetical protein [Fimbriimonadales bacterium]
MSRRKLVIIVLVSLLGVGGYLLWLLFSRETLLQVAEKVLLGIEKKDARLLMRYLSNEEKNLAGLNEENLQRFLNSFFNKGFQGFQRDGAPIIEISEVFHSLSLTQGYRHPDGREKSITITVAMTDEGIKAVNLTNTIFFASLYLDWPESLPRTGKNAAKLYAEKISKELSSLKTSGLNGVVQQPISGPSKFFTWEELIRRYEKIASPK